MSNYYCILCGKPRQNHLQKFCNKCVKAKWSRKVKALSDYSKIQSSRRK